MAFLLPMLVGLLAATETAEAQSVTRIPENQSVNLLNVSSQIIRQDYVQLDRVPSWSTCESEARRRVQALGGNVNAHYYYHRESNWLGIPDGPGHCYVWLFDPSAPRNAILTSALIAAAADAVPADLAGVVGALSEEHQRKVDGLHFRHFGFNAFDSSDVCLRKVERWRQEEDANWAVWSHQANNCFGILSEESFTHPAGVWTLNSFWSHSRADNWANASSYPSNRDDSFYRTEGLIFRPGEPRPAGTVPLYHWYSPSRGDHFLTTQSGWAGRIPWFDTRSPDYRFMGIEGYVFSPDRPRPAGAQPLYNWYRHDRGDNFLTTDPRWSGRVGERRDGYGLFRIEGYVLPAR